MPNPDQADRDNDSVGDACAFGDRCDPDTNACFDPRVGGVCAQGQVCSGGACVPDTSAQTDCPLCESCVEGACVPDDCGGITCPPGQACVAGACVVDACADVGCDPGTRCVEGRGGLRWSRSARIEPSATGRLTRGGQMRRPSRGLAQRLGCRFSLVGLAAFDDARNLSTSLRHDFQKLSGCCPTRCPLNGRGARATARVKRPLRPHSAL